MLKILTALLLCSSPLFSSEEINALLNHSRNTTSVGKRETYLNQTLDKLMAAPKQAFTSSDKLAYYRMIGNVFYQLEEFPWAILYYYKTLAIDPSDSEAQFNLKQAQRKLTLSQPYTPSFLQTFPYTFATILTLLLAGVTAAIGFFLSRIKIVYTALFLLTFPLLFTLGSYINEQLTPYQGVILYPTLMKKGPHTLSPVVTATPLLPGLIVRLVDADPTGEWMKILTDDNTIGYVFYTDMRSLDYDVQ